MMNWVVQRLLGTPATAGSKLPGVGLRAETQNRKCSFVSSGQPGPTARALPQKGSVVWEVLARGIDRWVALVLQGPAIWLKMGRASRIDGSIKGKTSMPNIASVLKDEVVRLARKEVRRELEGLKRASAQYRSDIAELKRRLALLDKKNARLEKTTANKAGSQAEEDATTRTRFSAKGLATHRQRLGLSAADMGALLGVSAQSIYHWESGKSKPREQQLSAIATVRSMGKRQAKARLAELNP